MLTVLLDLELHYSNKLSVKCNTRLPDFNLNEGSLLK